MGTCILDIFEITRTYRNKNQRIIAEGHLGSPSPRLVAVMYREGSVNSSENTENCFGRYPVVLKCSVVPSLTVVTSHDSLICCVCVRTGRPG